MSYCFGLPNELVDIDKCYQLLTTLHTKEIRLMWTKVETECTAGEASYKSIGFAPEDWGDWINQGLELFGVLQTKWEFSLISSLSLSINAINVWLTFFFHKVLVVSPWWHLMCVLAWNHQARGSSSPVVVR